MKRFLFGFSIVFVVFMMSSDVAEADGERYRYHAGSQVMVDQETGKVYFVKIESLSTKFIQVDFVKGSVEVVRELPSKELDLLEGLLGGRSAVISRVIPRSHS